MRRGEGGRGCVVTGKAHIRGGGLANGGMGPRAGKGLWMACLEGVVRAGGTVLSHTVRQSPCLGKRMTRARVGSSAPQRTLPVLGAARRASGTLPSHNHAYHRAVDATASVATHRCRCPPLRARRSRSHSRSRSRSSARSLSRSPRRESPPAASPRRDSPKPSKSPAGSPGRDD